MSVSFDIHRSKTRADWSYIDPSNQNSWQKLAASSNGWLTPANFISLVGAVLVIVGLIMLSGKITIASLLLILTGRLCDIADGFIAAKTGTKSPLGETIDAAIDKILAFMAIAIFIIADLAPGIVILLIALHSVTNALISLAARARKISLHPNRDGKLATMSVWAMLILWPPLYKYLHQVTSEINLVALGALCVAFLLLLTFIFWGFTSTVHYYQEFKNFSREGAK